MVDKVKSRVVSITLYTKKNLLNLSFETTNKILVIKVVSITEKHTSEKIILYHN